MAWLLSGRPWQGRKGTHFAFLFLNLYRWDLIEVGYYGDAFESFPWPYFFSVFPWLFLFASQLPPPNYPESLLPQLRQAVEPDKAF